MITKRMKKVVHIIPKFSYAHWGGAESAILHLCKRLPSFGFLCEVWANKVFSDKTEEYIDGILVRRIPCFYLTAREKEMAGIGKAGISIKMLLRILIQKNVDLIHLHCHNRLSSLVAMIASLRRLPIVLTIHSNVDVLLPRWRYWFPNEYAINKANKVIVVSDVLRENVLRIVRCEDRVVFVPNGIDLKRFSKGNGLRFRQRLGIDSGPIILSVGRICETKNQILLINAFSDELIRYYPNAHLIIIGFPSEQEYYKKLLETKRSSPLAKQIHIIPGLPPESDELIDAYAAANIVVMASKYEAFPISVLEAWAARKPVIVTNVGGLVQLMDDGMNGVIVKLEEAHERLDKNIVNLLSDPQRQRALGENGFLKVKRYDWDSIVKRVAQIYSEIV